MKKKIFLAVLAGAMLTQLSGTASAGSFLDEDSYDPYYEEEASLNTENNSDMLEKEAFTLDGYTCDTGKQGFYIVESESGMYGLVDDNGNMVFPAVYDEMDFVNFKDQVLIKAKVEGKWGIYDCTGKEIIPMEYDEIQEGNSRYLVSKDDRQSILESDGTLVKELSGIYTRMDGDDFLVLQAVSDGVYECNLYDINENLLADDFGTFTNYGNKELIYGINSTHSDYYKVIDENGETVYIQENDKDMSERGFAVAFLSSDRYLQIQGGLLGPGFGDNEYYLYDVSKQEKYETQYTYMCEFDKDKIFCEKEEGVDIYDEDGNIRSLTFEEGYSNMLVYSDNAIIAIEYGETWRLYDSNGERITEDRYSDVDFEGEYVILKNLNGEYGIMDKSGKMIVPFGIITLEDDEYNYNDEEIERFDSVGNHLYIQTSPYEDTVKLYII